MNDITVKMKHSSTVRVTLLLIIMASLFSLNGCSSKHTVTYLPHKELCEPVALNKDVTEALKEYFEGWQGTRYRYGGLSCNGVDCSGFTLVTYKEVFGMDLPRTVLEQTKEGSEISKKSLLAGDLVFFKTGRYQRHVGIYLENDLFIHASQSKGVMVSSLNNVYWQKRFWQAHRLQPEEDLQELSLEVAQLTVPADS